MAIKKKVVKTTKKKKKAIVKKPKALTVKKKNYKEPKKKLAKPIGFIKNTTAKRKTGAKNWVVCVVKSGRCYYYTGKVLDSNINLAKTYTKVEADKIAKEISKNETLRKYGIVAQIKKKGQKLYI